MYLILADVLHDPIQFTISGAWLGFIAICTGIIAISGAGKNIIELLKKAKKPEKTQDDRIQALEVGLLELKEQVIALGEAHEQELVAIRTYHKQEIDCIKKNYDDIISHYHKTKSRHDDEINDLGEGILVNLKATTAILNAFIIGENSDKQQIKDSLNEINDYIYKKSSMRTID